MLSVLFHATSTVLLYVLDTNGKDGTAVWIDNGVTEMDDYEYYRNDDWHF